MEAMENAIEVKNLSAWFGDHQVLREITMGIRRNSVTRMSVYDNVAVGLRFNGKKSRAEIADTVEKSLRMAALWDEVKDHLDRMGPSLSGGQQQRLCIARALAVEPAGPVLDSPGSVLA